MGALSFDPDAVLDEIRNLRPAPAKVANPAKVEPNVSNFSRFSRASPAEFIGRRHDEAAFEERAALIEAGSGVQRDWAESFARLDLMVPPPGFQPDRWRQLIDDGGRLLDRWATKAASLGWSTEEVFGIGPADASEQQGLVAFIRGGDVTDIYDDHAVLRSTMGSCLLLLRCARGGRAMWEVAQE